MGSGAHQLSRPSNLRLAGTSNMRTSVASTSTESNKPGSNKTRGVSGDVSCNHSALRVTDEYHFVR